MAIVVNLPTTRAGRDLLRNSIKVDGLREVYPDGTRIAEMDWDQVARLVDSYARKIGA